MTQEKKSIYARLHRIQVGLKAPKEKNQNVAYKSRSAEQILEAAKELLEDGEYITCQDEIELVGARFYVKAQAEFGFEGSAVIRTGYAREPEESRLMQPPQLTGSSSSYARKYALGGLFAIDDSTDDPDKTQEEKAPRKAPPGKMNPMDKSGNKAVDKAVMDGIQQIKNTIDIESARHLGRTQWKFCKEAGASQEQIDLIQQETENHIDSLAAKGP